MKTTILSTAALLVAIACATTMPTVPASDVLATDSGVDAATLDRGRALWTRECATCHRTYWPHEYPPERWSSLGPDMGDRAGMGPEDIDALTKFLMAASRYTRAPEATRSSALLIGMCANKGTLESRRGP